MQTTNTNTEATPVKAGRSKSSWEKLGVKFSQSECIPFGIGGTFGEPHMDWQAVYKNIMLASGGRSLDRMIEWMNAREDKIIAKMKAKPLWKTS